MTALTVYFTGAASTTLSTANKLYTISGSPANTHTYSRVGTATGYGEITSQGTTNAWVASGSIGSPTGKGFLYDVTTLEAQQIASGNWSSVVRLNCAQAGDTNPQAGSLTADIIVRAYKRSSGGTYTSIVSMTLTAQSLTSAFTNYTLPSTSASAVSFATGDKLYIDVWLNVTANANGSGVQDVRLNRLSSDTTGLTGDPTVEVVTPGYSAASTAHTQSVGSRLLQALAHTQSVGVRLRQALAHTQSVPMRLRQAVAGTRIVGTRLRQAISRAQSTPSRLRLALIGVRSQSARFLLASSHVRTLGMRFLQATARVQDAPMRIRQAIGHTLSTGNRLRQALLRQKGTSARFRQALPHTQSTGVRIKKANSGVRSAVVRLLLANQHTISVGSRLLQAKRQTKYTSLRLRNSIPRSGATGCRFCLHVATAPAFSVTWLARDNQAVWLTRDDKAAWKARG